MCSSNSRLLGIGHVNFDSDCRNLKISLIDFDSDFILFSGYLEPLTSKGRSCITIYVELEFILLDTTYRYDLTSINVQKLYNHKLLSK